MIKRLWYGCFFAHGNLLRERNQQGVLILTCERCHESHVPDLSKDSQQGIAHQPADVLGKPTYKVRRHLKPGNVRAFR